MSNSKFSFPSKLIAKEDDVWRDFEELGSRSKAISMGGFPDYIACEDVTKILAEVSINDANSHQYTEVLGHPRLLNVLGKLYSKLTNRSINPDTEILTTIGAFQAISSTILAHINEGDEIILIEPYFPEYLYPITFSKATIRFVSLHLSTNKKSGTSADWTFDAKELESAFNEKTKIIIFNNPNNPLGKVFDEHELEIIANLCIKYNVLCLSDEVYEWMVYKPNKHIRIATLPGMWERTITVCSAGKSFGITGWRIGWAYGPQNLISNLRGVHRHCVNSISTVIQEAVAVTFEKALCKLDKEELIFNIIRKQNEEKRDYMVKILTDVGMKPIVPQGGIFIAAQWTPLEKKLSFDEGSDKYKDVRLARWMIKSLGLHVTPISMFYSKENGNLGESYIRLCFMKKDETLREVENILCKL